jgi:arylsulfatase A-like enzyme
MEIAYRMQTDAPEVFDIRKESQATLDLYGEGFVARGCLMAVRLAEKGVRMTQVYYSKGDPWDAHGDIFAHKINAKNSDQPFAAVVKDLKTRGLWKDTLVVCGSEFGRTPVREVGGGGGNFKRGRDHNPFAFTMWLAGGAVKGGTIYGATDDFGFKAVEKPVHVHDIHATILYLMGIDHTKLTYRYSGRDFRLTDVSGNVLHELIA